MPDRRALPGRPPVAGRLPVQRAIRTHLEAISDETGVFQHAVGPRPDPVHGHCTDDLARALQVDLLQASRLGWGAVSASAERNLAFLEAAWVQGSARFRNFRAVDGTWRAEPGSDDCQGRAIHALADAMAARHDVRHAARAAALFRAALPGLRRIESPRALASVVLACGIVVRAGGPATPAAIYRHLALRLATLVDEGIAEHGSAAWPWPEGAVTYENALVPRALIVAGTDLGEPALRRQGLAMLDWLIEAQTAPDGHLSPVGNGWWTRGGTRSRFDQQPIEAATLLMAAEAAHRATGLPRYREAMERAYAWFLGANDVGISIADPARGACHDGLEADRVNQNQGAESTLMWLNAVERIAAVRAMEVAPPLDEARRDRGTISITAVPAASSRLPVTIARGRQVPPA